MAYEKRPAEERVTRRQALGALGAVGFATALPRVLAAQTGSAKPLQLTVHSRDVVARVPSTFTGLSYESAQLAHPAFFAGSNAQLVALVRTLGARGVLRIGGNTSAFTTWVSGAGGDASDGAGYGPDRGAQATKQVPGMYRITPAAIDNLSGFLDKTGWQLIYGLNLRHGTPETAVDEAAYVVKACGSKLLALQFGNEPDLFRHDDGGDGGKGSLWTYEEFLPKWKAMYAAVHARMPGIAIAGPDSAFRQGWAGHFAEDTRGEISLLTTHYYAEGPPTDPKMTIDYLLHPGERLAQDVYSAIDAAKAAQLPFRMSEGNSCYNGGKPGVSDTFASALWAGDFMLDLAGRGVTGVNLHGGGTGVYTPIATDASGQSSARPDFYGMWLAGQFAGAEMVRTELGAAARDANVTAYAARIADGVLVAVFNKGQSAVDLQLEGVAAAGRTMALTAPSLDSTSGVQLGRGERASGKIWTAEPDGSFSHSTVRVAAASALLLRAGRG